MHTQHDAQGSSAAQAPGFSLMTSGEALGLAQGPVYPYLYSCLGNQPAVSIRGWPVMVVDCGSALTFTACDRKGRLGGGAILPGVRLQLAALGARTAQLPSDVSLPAELPPRRDSSTSTSSVFAGVGWLNSPREVGMRHAHHGLYCGRIGGAQGVFGRLECGVVGGGHTLASDSRQSSPPT